MDKKVAEYEALCIDTCVYEAHGLGFERGLLKQLEQFSTIPAALIVPEIVRYELERHLSDRIREARTQIGKALRIAADKLQVIDANVQAAQRLLVGEGDETVCSGRLESFYERTAAEVVPSSAAAMNRLVKMYFDSEAPFEASGKKKSEFPDAIALLSVEDWAAKNFCKVLVVSTDHGWRDFCRRSDRLDHVDDLAEALAHFQPHNAAVALIEEIKRQIMSDGSNGIVATIRDEIARSVERVPIYAEASSSYHLDERYVDAAYLRHEYRKDSSGDPELNLIRFSSDELVVQLAATVSCEITAEYRLSIRDPIDRDYVSLGSTKAATTNEFDADIVVTLSGDLGSGLQGLEVAEVEIEGDIGAVDFGDIDPDPDRDEWDRERYA